MYRLLYPALFARSPPLLRTCHRTQRAPYHIQRQLNIQGVNLVGLAKARTESAFQSKEVKTSQERLFLPNRKDPIALKPGSAELRLLTHIRDEAHRFAITYHRHLRNKKVP